MGKNRNVSKRKPKKKKPKRKKVKKGALIWKEKLLVSGYFFIPFLILIIATGFPSYIEKEDVQTIELVLEQDVRDSEFLYATNYECEFSTYNYFIINNVKIEVSDLLKGDHIEVKVDKDSNLQDFDAIVKIHALKFNFQDIYSLSDSYISQWLSFISWIIIVFLFFLVMSILIHLQNNN